MVVVLVRGGIASRRYLRVLLPGRIHFRGQKLVDLVPFHVMHDGLNRKLNLMWPATRSRCAIPGLVLRRVDLPKLACVPMPIDRKSRGERSRPPLCDAIPYLIANASDVSESGKFGPMSPVGRAVSRALAHPCSMLPLDRVAPAGNTAPAQRLFVPPTCQFAIHFSDHHPAPSFQLLMRPPSPSVADPET